VIYWTWSNILTIGQQWVIKRGVERDYPELAKLNKRKPKPRQEDARAAPGGGDTQETPAAEPAAEPDAGSEPSPTAKDRHGKARGKKHKPRHGGQRK